MPQAFVDNNFGGLFKQTAAQFGADLSKMVGGAQKFQTAIGTGMEAARAQTSVGGIRQANSFTSQLGGGMGANSFTTNMGVGGANRFASSFGGQQGKSGFQTSGGGGIDSLNNLMQGIGGTIAAKQAERAAQMGQYAVGGTVGNAGAMHDPAGWANINRWNSGITKAVAQVQQELGVAVPYDVVKAVMMIESGGQFNEGQGAESEHGARGLMQVTTSTLGNYDYNRLLTDADYGIYAGVKELALRYQDSGRMPWENVIVGYFSGHYVPNGAGDGLNSDYNYQKMFLNHMNTLKAGAGSTPGAGINAGIGGTTTGFGGVFNLGMLDVNGKDWGVSQGVEESTAMNYGYGHAYGLTGNTHPGVDVTMPFGTKVVSPWGGTVVCVGSTAGGGGPKSSGCGAYLDAAGGVGRIMIRLDNGEEVIFGHMNGSNVQVGQRVSAGAIIGTSGTYNGDHIHLEYRVPCPGTTSGFCVIDPREGKMGSGFNGTTPGPSQPVDPAMQIRIPQLGGGGNGIFGGVMGGGTGYNPGARQNVFFGRSLFG